MFCPACGSRNADTDSACATCGKPLPSPDAAAAAPSPAAAERPQVGGFPVAGLGDRLIAVVLDTLVLGAAFAVAGMWAGARWGGTTTSGFSVTGKPALVAIGIVLAVGFLYTWLLEGIFGATLGKAMAGVQVRMKDGRKCTLRASLVRNVFRVFDALVIYLLGFLIAIFSKLRQRLGDHVAGTVVVQRSPAPVLRIAAVVVWLGCLAGGAYGAYALHGGTGAGHAPSQTAGVASPQPLTESGFTLSNLRLVQSEDGAVREPGPYKPGDDVYLRYELSGQGRDERGRIDVVITMVAYDPSGAPLDKPARIVLRDEAASGAPINGKFHFHLPPFVPPGTYRVAIRIEDAVRKSTAEFSPTVTVNATRIAPATKLEVRDLAFLASEEGPSVTPPVFGAGQKIHYSFGIFGLGFREDRASLRIGYRLIGPSGEVVVERPDWQDVEDTFAYHPPTFFLPLTAYVSLNAEAPKGRYVQRHTIEDRIAGARLEYESAFEIR